MLIMTIPGNSDRTKFEIYKHSDDDYSVRYMWFDAGRWTDGGFKPEHYSRDCLEWEFEISVA